MLLTLPLRQTYTGNRAQAEVLDFYADDIIVVFITKLLSISLLIIVSTHKLKIYILYLQLQNQIPLFPLLREYIQQRFCKMQKTFFFHFSLIPVHHADDFKATLWNFDCDPLLRKTKLNDACYYVTQNNNFNETGSYFMENMLFGLFLCCSTTALSVCSLFFEWSCHQQIRGAAAAALVCRQHTCCFQESL